MLNFQDLVRDGLGEAVSVREVISLKGDASSRRYHRAVLEGAPKVASVIVMELPEDPSVSDEGTNGDTPEELPFLNVGRFMAEAGLPVPRVFLDATERGALVLEDLGDDTLVRRLEGLGSEDVERWYEAAVDLMSEMHDRMWPVREGCLAAKRSFDIALLRWELDHYREWGVEATAGKPLSPEVRGRLDRAFDALAEEIFELPQGFVHRDYQSRNLMITGRAPDPASFSIIDFQDALTGPRIYDLVALLNDSYVNLTRELQERIIRRYASNRSLDAQEVLTEFDLVTVQRKLKDGGRFVFIDRVKNNPSFLPFVDVSFGRVAAALDRLPGHRELKEALAAADPAHFAHR